jgi:hypothetical protein
MHVGSWSAPLLDDHSGSPPSGSTRVVSDTSRGDQRIDVSRVEAHVVTDLVEHDSALGHEATDEPHTDVQAIGNLLDRQQVLRCSGSDLPFFH